MRRVSYFHKTSLVLPAVAFMWVTALLAVSQTSAGENELEPENPATNQAKADHVDPEKNRVRPGKIGPGNAEQQQGSAVQAHPAQVIDVTGTVEWALSGVSALATQGWAAVLVNDELQPGTLIRTGLRSSVNLQFGETTYISVRSATFASIDEFYKSATKETVRMGLGYGTVRGGSTEGEVVSDVIVDSTVATLAKRGTEGWEMYVEPHSRRFRISLAEYGLVEARKKLANDRSVSRLVRPGEYATDRNIANMWIKQAIFDRNVKFYEARGVSASDADFMAKNTRGYATMAPGGGSELIDATGRLNSTFIMQQIATNFPDTGASNLAILQPTIIGRPEGNFGTGNTFRLLMPDRRSGSNKSRFKTGRMGASRRGHRPLRSDLP